jgi:integrase
MALTKRGDTYHVHVVVNGVRYRQSLHTGNWQEAQRKQKELINLAMEGKAGSPTKRGSYASLPLESALDQLIMERAGRVAERTSQIDRERSKVLKRYLGSVSVRKIDASTIHSYQDRRAKEVSGRTVNLEVTLLRQVLKRAKRWSVIADEVSNLPENQNIVGRVLTREQKVHLFRTAGSKPEWDVAFCAAVVAVNTTCRKVELLGLRWSDVDLFGRVISIRRSKTEAGHRSIPLNSDAMAAFARLRRRADLIGSSEPTHFVFPACENGKIDPAHPQKSWRSAWRSLTRAAGFKGLRFHDLRHQSITEMAEQGVPDAAMQSIAGHLSKKMLDHYSHVRMAAKRSAVDVLSGGLMSGEELVEPATTGKAN